MAENRPAGRWGSTPPVDSRREVYDNTPTKSALGLSSPALVIVGWLMSPELDAAPSVHTHPTLAILNRLHT
jgi:hypothetical protein